MLTLPHRACESRASKKVRGTPPKRSLPPKRAVRYFCGARSPSYCANPLKEGQLHDTLPEQVSALSGVLQNKAVEAKLPCQQKGFAIGLNFFGTSVGRLCQRKATTVRPGPFSSIAACTKRRPLLTGLLRIYVPTSLKPKKCAIPPCA